MPWADGPFEVLEKVSDNAYKVELHEDYGLSCTLNVADLKPYFEDDNLENLRANSFLEGEDDVPMKGILDQDKVNPRNQEIKALSFLFKELQPVGETVVKAEVQTGIDLGKGHLC